MEVIIVLLFGVLAAVTMNAVFGKNSQDNTACYNKIPPEVHKWGEKVILGPRGEHTGVTRLYCVKCNRTSDQMN